MYIKAKSNYSISGTTLTFSTAPPTGSAVEVMTFTQTDINVPVDGTITSAKLSGDLTTPGALTVTGTATADKVTIGTSSASNGKLTLEGVDGADSAGIYFNNTTATNGKSYSLSSGNSGEFMLYDRTSSAYRLFVSSAGNVGIGTSSPATQLFVKSASNAANVFAIESADASQRLQFGVNTSNGGSYIFEQKAQALRFGTSDTERMRINSNGLIGVGTTLSTGIAVQSSDTGIQLDSSGRIFQTISDHNDLNRTANGETFRFRRSATQVGSISVTASATAFNTSSDYRLKENITDLTSATDRLKQLAPKRFNFINDADTTVDGFLAHEVQAVVPEAITGTKDAVDADGNPDYQGIDQSKLVPLLVATIQELEARLTALENN